MSMIARFFRHPKRTHAPSAVEVERTVAAERARRERERAAFERKQSEIDAIMARLAATGQLARQTTSQQAQQRGMVPHPRQSHPGPGERPQS